jgi:hypothetical protein
MNFKKIALSVIAVAALWFVFDWVIHNILLMDIYRETSQLWRPAEEMNHAYGITALLISSALFVMFYVRMIVPKNLAQGGKFGCWVGAIIGLWTAMSYVWMPIPFVLAVAWFFADWVKGIVAGYAVGYLMKDSV